MDQQLYLVFPEQASKELLVKRLVEAGFLEQNLEKAGSQTEEDIVRKYYISLAALPRRLPRNNRQGRYIKRLREKEPKVAYGNVLLRNAMHQKSQQPRVIAKTEQSVSSTPELDRLAARSKVAKQSTVSKRKLSPSKQSEAAVAKVTPPKKIVLNRRLPNLPAACIDKNTSVSLHDLNATKNSTSDSNLTSTDKSSLKDTENHAVVNTGKQRCCKTDNDESKTVAKKATKRIKLKRNSFQNPPLDCSKVKKTS